MIFNTLNKFENILIVDDSELYRMKLSYVLTDEGHKVKFARNGREAIDAIKGNPEDIDLVLLDLNMPEIDGFGVLKWIKENGLQGKIPVLVITGYYDIDSVMEQLRNLGASGFLSKESTPEQIMFHINRILYSHKFTEWSKREERVRVYLHAEFIYKDKKYDGIIININENGAFIQTEIEINKGDVIDLRLSLPEMDKALDIKSSACWCSQTLKNGGLLYWSGLKFDTASRGERPMLKDFIAAVKNSI